jgi:hypothetical protein
VDEGEGLRTVVSNPPCREANLRALRRFPSEVS